MIVKISDFGRDESKNFVDYNVSGLSSEQLNYLNDNLTEKTEINGDILKITMYFDDELYPFGSEVAKLRLDDFIAREEIEMSFFLSSFLEDM